METITKMQRSSFVRAGRALNASLDFVFYDINSLSPKERVGLSAGANPEGSILIVHPKNAGEEITKFTPWEFITGQRESEGSKIDAVVVPGVGSSALGTAALARNTADYLQRPVAGVVSGLGVADVVSEALGGWFVLGSKNRIRDSFAKAFDAFDMKDHVWDDTSYNSLVKDRDFEDFDMDRFVYGSPDSLSLLLMLYHLRDSIKVLIGHSKGNYIIENALEGLLSLCKLKKHDVPKEMQVITMGAVIRFPEEFQEVKQYIGGLDFFGMINSRFRLNSSWVPGSWHSLNSSWPGYMSVEEILKRSGVK